MDTRPTFLALRRAPDSNFTRQSRLLNMDYKGIEYQVVQTSNPNGWKWTVEMEGRAPRVGSGHSRAAAIALAQIAIDKLVKQNPGRQSDRL
jgi:hypothetical protein